MEWLTTLKTTIGERRKRVSIRAVGTVLAVAFVLGCVEDKDVAAIRVQAALEARGYKCSAYNDSGNLRVKVDRLEQKDMELLASFPIGMLLSGDTSVDDISALGTLPIMEIVLTRSPILDPPVVGVPQHGPLKGIEALTNAPLQSLVLDWADLRDVAEVGGLRHLRRLALNGCPKLTNIEPLAGLSLEYLSLDHTAISDISPLSGMPLRSLQLAGTSVSNLAPLADMPLKSLDVSFTKVMSLDKLKGLPLEDLRLSGTQVRSLAGVEGMPLEILLIEDSLVTDLTPVGRAPLRLIVLTPERITGGLDVLKEIGTLKTIRTRMIGGRRFTPDEFWRWWKGSAPVGGAEGK